jgi:MFS family permease
MSADLGLSGAQFGFASGLFFVGYILLEVPSNLVLHKVGARRWLARIMVSWGIVTLLTALAQNFFELTALRVLLGVTEAGFFPGAVFYLSTWVPGENRAKIFAIFMMAQPLAPIIGSPVDAALIAAKNLLGLPGWRIMFMGVGIPAIIVGCVCWFYLKDRPSEAKWLTPAEQAWLTSELETDRRRTESRAVVGNGVMAALRSGRVWMMWIYYFGVSYGVYAVTFFLPTIIKAFHQQYGWSGSVWMQGIVTALVYVPEAFAIWFCARDAAKRGVHIWHVALPAALAGVAAAFSMIHGSPIFTLIMIAIIPAGVFAANTNFWVLPNRFLTGAQAAAAIALINTSNIGGFFGPYVTGWISDWTGSAVSGLVVCAVLMLISALMIILLVRTGRIPGMSADLEGRAVLQGEEAARREAEGEKV